MILSTMRRTFPLSLAGLLGAGQVLGAGFQLTEQSVPGLGRSFAGGALAGDDASAVFFNPAEMTLTAGSIAQFATSVISVQADFEGTSRRGAVLEGTPVQVPGLFRGNGEGGTTGVVPVGYYLTEFDDRIKVGIGLTVPFGLKTDYDEDWVGRYHALESEVKTIDIQPAIAYRVNDQWSVGGGISVQYIEATLRRALFTGAGNPDGKVEVTGDNIAYGYSLGVMYQPTGRTRFGLSYRSKIDQQLEGGVDVSGVPGRSGRFDGGAGVILPESVGLSAFHRFDDRWALLLGARWTRWSRFDELRIEREGGEDDVTREDWDNQWFLSAGVEHYYSDNLTLRAGAGYDDSPIPTTERRTPRIPDGDRRWLSLGLSYKPSVSLSLDFGYAHLFVDDLPLNATIELLTGVPGLVVEDFLQGEYESGVDIVGAQLTYRF